jgi:broad specificity phosphatase PhoE
MTSFAAPFHPLSADMLFVRHAQTTLNQQGRWQGRDVDPPLSQAGIQAVRGAAGLLLTDAPYKPRTVLVSPLRRTIETAEVLVDAGMSVNEIIVCNELIEADVGWMTGRTWQEFTNHSDSELWNRGLTPGFDKGESRDKLLARAGVALGLALNVDRPLIVSHLMLLTAIREVVGLAIQRWHIENLGAFGSWMSNDPMNAILWRDLRGALTEFRGVSG